MKRLNQIVARMAEIQDRLDSFTEVSRSDDFAGHSDDVNAEIDGLLAEFSDLETEATPLRERAEALERVSEFKVEAPTPEAPVSPQYRKQEDPFDLNTLRTASTSELRSRAVSAVEAIPAEYAGDEHREAIVSILESRSTGAGKRVWDDTGVIPRMVLRMGSGDYHSAFGKAITGQADFWTPAERAAMAEAQTFRTHMGLTDAVGGFGVPVTLDPALIMTDAGSANPFRQNLARVVTITNDQWQGLSSAGITAGYGAEATEATDNSPGRAGPTIKAEKAHAFVAASIEVTMDYPGLVADLRMEFQDAKDDLEATAFASGSGSDAPTGITTALDGGTSEIGPGTAETFAFNDWYTVLGDLPPKARSAAARTAWLMHNGTMLQNRQLAAALASQEGTIVNPTAGAPGQFLGIRYEEASGLDNSQDIDDTASADNFVGIVGDWRKFVVVDRVGLSIEYIPHLFGGTANYPTGERGWYAFWRSGSDSVADDHFRMYSIPTTA